MLYNMIVFPDVILNRMTFAAVGPDMDGYLAHTGSSSLPDADHNELEAFVGFPSDCTQFKIIYITYIIYNTYCVLSFIGNHQ